MKTFLQILFLFLIITQMCLAQGSWKKVGNMPFDRFGHSVNELNGKIYVVGGSNYEGGTLADSVLVYDTTSGEWSQISIYNNILKQLHCSCVVDGKLYIIGGNDGSKTSATVELLDPITNEWTPKTPMPTARDLAACVTIDDKIFVIGGVQLESLSYEGLNRVEVYDTKNDTWTRIADMPSKRWGLSATVANDKIYVIGGRSSEDPYGSIEVYDPQTNIWTTHTKNMPTPRYCLSTCLLDSNLYAIGGWFHSSAGPVYDKVEVYNPRNDEWYVETPIPVAICAPSIVLNDKIYLYGGTNTTHPNMGTSAIYEFTNLDLFAFHTSINKTYAKLNTDSVLFRTKFYNFNNVQFTPYLIYTNSDSTQIDSLNLFDDGTHGDSLLNDGIYGCYIPPIKTEDFFTLSVSTIEEQTNNYNKVPIHSIFTTAGPLRLDSVLFTKDINRQFFRLTPFVRNDGNSLTIKSAKIKLYCTDPWVDSILTGNSLTDITPGTIVASSSQTVFFYIDSLLPSPEYFNIRAEITSNGILYWTDLIRIGEQTTDVEDKESFPLNFALSQNYPNPFNPSTKIKYSVPQISQVQIKVFDVLGSEIKTLVNGEKPIGIYELNWNAADLPSGVYFYQLKAGEYIAIKKMILLK